MCQTKICTNCKENKTLESFGKSKRTVDGKQHHCKVCVNLKKSILNLSRVLPEYAKSDTRNCSVCKLDKFLEYFSNSCSNPSGKMYDCKECRKKYHTPKKEGVKIFTDKQERICTKCSLVKPFSEFNTSKKSNCGVGSICKFCAEEARKLKKEIVKEVPDFKICTKCNIEKDSSSFVKDISKSDGISCVCKPCTNKHRVHRCSTDATFRLSNSIRKTMTSAFANCVKGKYTKSNKTENILGVSFSDFKYIIESQFLNWMNWDNYGKYNGNIAYGYDIDHIIPISYAKTEDEIYLLNHWSNFQPLCSKINRDTKKAKVYPCTNLELRITFWEDYYEYI